MASGWSSVLYVFCDEAGDEYVSVSLPSSVGIQGWRLRAYRVSGSCTPAELPSPKKVDSAEEWMSQQERQGFSFRPIHV